jgi:hypothetical protein
VQPDARLSKIKASAKRFIAADDSRFRSSNKIPRGSWQSCSPLSPQSPLGQICRENLQFWVRCPIVIKHTKRPRSIFNPANVSLWGHGHDAHSSGSPRTRLRLIAPEANPTRTLEKKRKWRSRSDAS